MEFNRPQSPPEENLRAPADFADRILAKINQENISPVSRLGHHFRMAGIAAVLLISAGFGIWLGTGYNNGGGSISRSSQSIQEFQKIHNLSSGVEETCYYNGT